MSAADVAKIAFDLHEKKLLSRDELVCVLQDLVNAAAIDNGYADKHGLPFPARGRRGRRAHRAP